MKRKQLLIIALFMGSLAAFAQPTGSGWTKVFEDEFNGSSLNTSKWKYNYTWGNYHNYHAVCAQSNVYCQNGNLVIKAERGKPSWAKDTHKHGGKTYKIKYTTGAIHSIGSYTPASNKIYWIEATMKFPNTKGVWPAFWMLGYGQGWPPEIDILEWPNNNKHAGKKKYYLNYHWKDNGHKSSGRSVSVNPNLTTSFNRYSIKLKRDKIQFYFNGWKKHEVSGSKVNQCQNMYMILNFAVGGWGNVTLADNDPNFPCYFEIGRVTVWEKDPTKSTEAEENITDIESIDNRSMKLFPNPLKSDESISLMLDGFDSNELVNVSVFNMQGKEVFKNTYKGAQEIEILPGTLSTGMYLINIDGKDILYREKLMIQ